MLLADFRAALIRRWYLFVAAVVLAAVSTTAVVLLVGPTYEAKGAVLVIPPATTVQQARSGVTDNPLLSLGGVNQARDIVIRSLTAKSTFEELCRRQGDAAYLAMRAELCSSRPGVEFEATPEFASSAPIILITVEADSAANSITALNAVMRRVPEILTELQAELKLRPRAQITSLPVVADQTPDVVRRSQLRAGIVAGAAALGLGLLAIGLLDGVLLGRRRRDQENGRSDDGWTPTWEGSAAEGEKASEGEKADAEAAPAPKDKPEDVPVSSRHDAMASGR